jgi:3,4-dihydroxy-2-butanone 4-phosphate synthase
MLPLHSGGSWGGGPRDRNNRGGAVMEKALAALRDGSSSCSTTLTTGSGRRILLSGRCGNPQHILQMRMDGGGMICTAIHPVAAQRLGSVCKRCSCGRWLLRSGREISRTTVRKPFPRFSIWVNTAARSRDHGPGTGPSRSRKWPNT